MLPVNGLNFSLVGHVVKCYKLKITLEFVVIFLSKVTWPQWRR